MPALRVLPATPDLVRFLALRFSAEQREGLERHGAEAVLQSLESSVRQAARTWCGVDAGGPVVLLIASPLGIARHRRRPPAAGR